jgi:hypothetical protein
MDRRASPPERGDDRTKNAALRESAKDFSVLQWAAILVSFGPGKPG